MTVKILKLLFIFLFSIFIFSCSSADKKPETAEEAFKIAKDLEDADRYQAAIQRYNDVKNKFPYSALATEAELAAANVHFKSEDYVEAQISYQNFRELHPKHPKVDFVIYRIGMSYYMQLPETIDRDITLANDAIYSFNELIKKYPKSEYYADAQENRRKAFSMLNEKELYVADFYFKKELYDSALLRYVSSYKKYPDFGYQPRSLAGAIKSSIKMQDKENQKTYTDLLLSKFPDSVEAKEIKREGLK
jgi:outer membrane protein assembly factor BamD